MTDTIREPQEILRVEHLSVSIRSGSDEIPVLRDVSFAIRQGERWAIAGESGAGKSMTMKAITALLPEGSTKISGRILFRVGEEGRWQDLLEIPYRERHRFVAEQIAIIFQDAINALNPNERIETQWGGTIRLHDPSMQGEALTAHMLEQMEIFLMFQSVFGQSAICELVSLGPGGLHCRTAAFVKHPELDHCMVDKVGHLAPQGIDLPHYVALGQPSHCRIT